MTEVHVLPTRPGEFAVDCTGGATATSHRVTVSEHLLDDIGLPRLEPHRLVEESFAFLLEREPNTSILREFPLAVISDYFPEYIEEMRTRLAG
jgi:hypothetical protein